MIIAVTIILGLGLALHLYRQSWVSRELEPIYHGEFQGDLYQAGDSYIGIRRGGENSKRTIICVPGYVESMRYFQDLYAEVDCQLILLNNADYHCPFKANEIKQLDWEDNPHSLGSIDHDAYRLGQVIREFARTDTVILHGHSRGGAVILDCGAQFPELARQANKSISAILEAPVLPGALLAGNGSKPLTAMLTLYLAPIIFGRGRNTSAEELNKLPIMNPTNTLKTDICLPIFSSTRHYSTNVINMRNIIQWQQDQSDEVYKNFEHITVVVGERDDVLDNPSMIASAERGTQLNPGVNVLHTVQTNHFPTLEQPHYLLDLIPDTGQGVSAPVG